MLLQNEISELFADMNVILAYYNFLDDWTDDKNVLSLSVSKLFERQCMRIKVQYPRQCSAISKCLCELNEIEKSGELNPDVPANCFGKLMGEIFVLREDEYAEKLRTFGKSLGKFIYIMDGCMDLKSDIINERYNPMIMSSSENFYDILNLLMADCIENYKKMPINQDKGLIENILYSGVWTKYEAEKKKKKGEHK